MINFSELSRDQLVDSLIDIKTKIINYLQAKHDLGIKSEEVTGYKQDLINSVSKDALREDCIDFFIEDKIKNGNTDTNGKNISIFNLRVLANEGVLANIILYGSIFFVFIAHYFVGIAGVAFLWYIPFIWSWIISIVVGVVLYFVALNYIVINSDMVAAPFINDKVDKCYNEIINDKFNNGETAEKWKDLNQQKNNLGNALQHAKDQLDQSGYSSLPEGLNSLDDINLAIHIIKIGRANDWRDCTNIIHQHRIEEENRQREQARIEEERRHHVQMEQLEQQRIQNELSHQQHVEGQNDELIKETRRTTEATENAAYQANKTKWVLKDIKRDIKKKM